MKWIAFSKVLYFLPWLFLNKEAVWMEWQSVGDGADCLGVNSNIAINTVTLGKWLDIVPQFPNCEAAIIKVAM